MIEMKEQKFGLELEFSGITRKRAAYAVQKALSGSSVDFEGGAYEKWVTRDAQGRKWTVERDSSIVEVGRGQQCELVTPILNYADMETLQEVIRSLRRSGAKVNSSCGIHIHVDGANHTEKSLKNLLLTFRAKEDLLFRAVGTDDEREYRYCTKISEMDANAFKKASGTIKDTWYKTYQDFGDERCHYHASRYPALNLHSYWYRGTVEFRFFNSTLHAGEVRAYISLCLAMSAQAINSTRASAKVLENGNDKYAMRCWLLRLGFIGDEWKTVRNHLMKRLSGNAAWRNDPSTYESYRRRHEETRMSA